MCRALGVDGYDDPRVATIGERSQHRELTGEIMDRCYAAAADDDDRRGASARSRPRTCRAASCSRRPSSPTTRTRSRSGCSRTHVHPSSGGCASRATRREFGGARPAARRPRADARRAHRRDPPRARPRATASPSSAPRASSADATRQQGRRRPSAPRANIRPIREMKLQVPTLQHSPMNARRARFASVSLMLVAAVDRGNRPSRRVRNRRSRRRPSRSKTCARPRQIHAHLHLELRPISNIRRWARATSRE